MTSNSLDQHQSDDHFEENLRRFRPLPPRRLAIPLRRAPWPALAVAAGLLLAAGILLVPRHGQDAIVQPPLSQRVTIGRLNAALRENDQALSNLLDDASPTILPRGQHGTVLYELGKE